MSEAIAHEEKKNAAKLAKKLAAKERKQTRKAGTLSDLMKGVDTAQKEFDKVPFIALNFSREKLENIQKQAARDEVKLEAYETDAKKEAWYRKELKYVVNRADVVLEVSFESSFFSA